ncbi:hypothetical protein ACI798_01285 [Geodermatophilus sp. SYSU D01045]
MTTTRGAVRTGAVALAAALVHVLGVVVPFVANSLHHLPLAEVAGGSHDPEDLWPATVPVIGGTALAHAAVARGCVAVLAWFLGPTSETLISRQMD